MKDCYMLHLLCRSRRRNRIQATTISRRNALSHALLRKRTRNSRKNRSNWSWHSL